MCTLKAAPYVSRARVSWSAQAWSLSRKMVILAPASPDPGAGLAISSARYTPGRHCLQWSYYARRATGVGVKVY